jgi:hypothetical protein
MHSKLNLRSGITVAALALASWTQVLSTGCVGGGGGGGGVDYGDGPWFQDDVVVQGGGAGWYGRNDSHDRGYVHPTAGGHADSHSSPAAHASGGEHASGGGGHASGGDRK